MAAQNPPNLEPNIHGLILRTSSTFSGHYAYFPLPRALPTDFSFKIDNIFVDSLLNAPHFPDITIFDSVSSNILYQSNNSIPNLFHVYNLINRSHFAFSFPLPFTIVNVAILIRDCSHFKVLIVCINKRLVEGDKRESPLFFYLYNSEGENLFLLPYNFPLTSNHLLPNRRKPAHVGEDIVHLDLTNTFLFTYGYSNLWIQMIPKLTTIWEQASMTHDISTRYGESRGKLHCVKFNFRKIEVHKEIETRQGLWMLVVARNFERYWGEVLGIHPDDEGLVLVRSMETDMISLVDIQREISFVVIDGKGPNCGPTCFGYGMNDVLEASTSQGMQHSSCGILHPHENIKGPEGEIFIVSFFGTQLVSSPQNV
ncbi:hypothetical protein IEQ34_000148 [Dendrobium chrysotoxum]|uniref:Uncharacterized protein n=1 Tax=Dendrobium chrysotoxum TaxID=161865 RepID=A0AAV7HQJ7_DENCH|nr:hypothetical protein IEQ34_000148 [Dendrobium chrysotoxum]